jgi:chromosome partitioning protein
MEAASSKPTYIIFGNEKGGTGKSTLAIHVIMSLLHEGKRVGSIDIDGRQGTLSRYLENRRQNENLLMPEHVRISKDEYGEEEQKTAFLHAIENLAGMDYVVIDTPGTDSALSRFAHSYADTLITPINDSFIDLDLLVKLTSPQDNLLRPSLYAEMVWEQRKQKALTHPNNPKGIDWIVVRNRLGYLYSKNKEQVHEILTLLEKRIGFRLASGFGERVIFRELFLSGLTLLDLDTEKEKLTLSHAAARQELRSLILFMKQGQELKRSVLP